ncbi:MAG: response regulator [Candidatus Paceibacterota bacterium]
MENKYKVLIVEDDSLIRQIYFERLSNDSGMEVYTAVDGLDGLNKIKQNKYDLVFSGIQMPNKTGFELFQDLQNDTNLAHIPFVVFSHLGRSEDMQVARDLGIKHFIIRCSTTTDEVAQRLKDILDNNNRLEKFHIKQHKILIVEDNLEIRAIYVDRFRQDSSIIVEEGVDGVDGLNKIKENDYDLIFSGIYMPNKTGFELFQEVQQLLDKKHIPIVLFSHWGRIEDVEMAKKLGVKYFIIRGSNTPDSILNQIVDILNTQDKTYILKVSKDSPDYSKFAELISDGKAIEDSSSDNISMKVLLSKDVKPYTFFIELDDKNK